MKCYKSNHRSILKLRPEYAVIERELTRVVNQGILLNVIVNSLGEHLNLYTGALEERHRTDQI